MFKFNKIALLLISLIPLGYIIDGALPVFIEFTLLLYTLLYLMSAFKLIFSGKKLHVSKIDIILYILAFLLFFSLMYSPNTMAGVFKISKFLFLGLGLVLFCRIFINNKQDMEQFFKYFIKTSVVTSYAVLLDFAMSGANAFRYLAFGVIIPIPLALLGAVTFLTALILYFNERITILKLIFTVLPSVGLMTIAASKGPIISLGLTSILLLPLFVNKIKLKYLLTLPVLLYFVSQISFINKSMENLILRFSYMGDDLSTTIRVNMYREALDIFNEYPILGIGVGGLRTYPHNFIIEMVTENGLVFIIFVIVLLVILGIKYIMFILKNNPDYVEGIIIALIFISIISLLFSYTYVDHKYLFLSMGLYISYQKISKEEVTSKEEVIIVEKNNKFKKKFKKRLVW